MTVGVVRGCKLHKLGLLDTSSVASCPKLVQEVGMTELRVLVDTSRAVRAVSDA